MGSCSLIYEIEKGPQTIGRVNCPAGVWRSLKRFEGEGGGQTPEADWLSAPQGWRRHSASIGYRPHPGNHIYRWRWFYSKSACGQQKNLYKSHSLNERRRERRWSKCRFIWIAVSFSLCRLNSKCLAQRHGPWVKNVWVRALFFVGMTNSLPRLRSLFFSSLNE